MSEQGATNGSNGGNGHFVGRSMKRKEDPRFITGTGTYTDDMVLPGMLHAAFVRSPEAHARITNIDASAARAGEVGRRPARGAGGGAHRPASLIRSAASRTASRIFS